MATRLLTLSQTYGLASREMSLVAVVTRSGDRPGELPETRVVPVGMAQDTDFGAYFPGVKRVGAMCAPGAFPPAPATPPAALTRMMPKAAASLALFSLSSAAEVPTEVRPDVASRPETPEDILLDLASRMDSDGGMPGKDREARAIATIIALLAFLSQGHTPTDGAFRSHVARLVSFLKSLTGLPGHRQEMVAAVIELARKGTAPAGEWLTLARASGDRWKEVERSVPVA